MPDAAGIVCLNPTTAGAYVLRVDHRPSMQLPWSHLLGFPILIALLSSATPTFGWRMMLNGK